MGSMAMSVPTDQSQGLGWAGSAGGNGKDLTERALDERTY
jgi:hypothetical protein